MDPDAPLTEAEILAAPLTEHVALGLGELAEGASAGVTLSEAPVFNAKGMARIAVIRPCVSRGARIRNLPPIYTPQMLEANAGVFTGWPMYFDHVSKRLAEMLQEAGRSSKEMAGQVLRAWWDASFTHGDDAKYGYQRGGVLAEVWGTPFLRELVSNNPNLLHTSINAWPKSGKPGPAPWAPQTKGMVIEGIREEPQGSVDFVPRGGAGGRLLAESDEALLVSVAERVYNSAQRMTTKPFNEMDAGELKEWARVNAPSLAESIVVEGTDTSKCQCGTEMREGEVKCKSCKAEGAKSGKPSMRESGLTEADVQRMIRESAEPEADRDERIAEHAEGILRERDGQRGLSEVAKERIKAAAGLTPSLRQTLTEKYEMLPSGPSPALLVEADQGGKDGAERSAQQVLEAAVDADVQWALGVIAEAKGKPRILQEGGGQPKNGGDGPASTLRERREAKVPLWRERFVEMGLCESEDEALTIYGAKAKTDADKAKAEA